MHQKSSAYSEERRSDRFRSIEGGRRARRKKMAKGLMKAAGGIVQTGRDFFINGFYRKIGTPVGQ